MYTAVWTTPEDEHGEATLPSFERAVQHVREQLDASPTKWGYVWLGGRFVATIWPGSIQLGSIAKELGIKS
jgi:hypothetical protein